MRILVVDDNPMLAAALGRTLRRYGHEAVLARSAAEGITLIDDGLDAVISDIDMPDVNGVEFARAIRGRGNDIPIAFCTGSAPDSEALKAARAIGPVLPKPWAPDQIASLLIQLANYRLAS